MIFKDYYKILGLDTNKVSVEKIKLAYREQAKKYHPDVNQGDTRAEARFKDINEAYKTLSDAASRKKYDRMWYWHIGKNKKRVENKEKNRKATRTEILKALFRYRFK